MKRCIPPNALIIESGIVERGGQFIAGIIFRTPSQGSSEDQNMIRTFDGHGDAQAWLDDKLSKRSADV